MQIYADNAATTKMSEAAIEAMTDCMRNWYGNPSSLYTIGQRAKEKLEEAREEIAALINAEPREIIFTSGGSEADNQALLTAAINGKKKSKTHIISSAFEHHAILHTLNKLEQNGFEVTLLPVHENGDRNYPAYCPNRRNLPQARRCFPYRRGAGGGSSSDRCKGAEY